MARPQKEGLDYFPLDVDIAEDKRVQFVVGKCGQEGFATIIHLLMAIYRNGYYLTWDELELYSTSQRINLPVNTISEVVSHLLNYGFFDKEKFDLFGILTSHGIQTRYLRACEYRKKVKMVKEFCMVTPEDGIKESRFEYINPPKTIKQVVNTTSDGIKRVGNPNTSELTACNADVRQVESTQIKVKESNEEEEETPYIPPAESKLTEQEEEIARIVNLFENNIHPLSGMIEQESLLGLLDEYGAVWLDEAIRWTVERHGNSVKYIQAILEQWKRVGFKNEERSKTKNERGLQGTRRKNQREQGEDELSESRKRIYANIEAAKNRPKPWEVQRADGQ